MSVMQTEVLARRFRQQAEQKLASALTQQGRGERPGRKKGEIMREYSRNPTYPDGDAYDPTYIPKGKEVKSGKAIVV